MGRRKHQPKPVAPENVSIHPATAAWTSLLGTHAKVRGITALTEKRKASVFRLDICGWRHPTVIAKWSSFGYGTSTDVECRFYEHLLPSAGLPAPELHGRLTVPADDGVWLFIEDLGDETPSLRSLKDQRLVARWLATLHQWRGFSDLAADRGSTGYLRMTESLYRTVEDNLDQPWVTETRRSTLSRMLHVLERLERNWIQLDAVCSLAPQTVVHGDLVRKNVRITNKGGVRELVVLDWEEAGVGVPSIDFSIPCDLPYYVATVDAAWPAVSLGIVQQLAQVGRIFRSLAVLDWQAVALPYEWSAMTSFEDAERWLQESVSKAMTADWI